ncbi:RNA polymerase sigma factor [Marinicella sp. W31]|uniref:RNA polymerase sigma factor n=1 Tax=Marinicella sp. W31 TaxID=3023713 RepID=UPI00375631D3
MEPNFESTATLLFKIKAGDEQARERLFKTYLPIITDWAHGRLPKYARDLSETADMVQKSLLAALQKVDDFEALREGAFLAYLRQVLLNNIRMEIRRVSRKNRHGYNQNDAELIDEGASVIEHIIGDEALQAYEKGLMSLKDKAREAVILRVEFGYSFAEISEAVEMKSANAARMLVSRSIVEMSRNM